MKTISLIPKERVGRSAAIIFLLGMLVACGGGAGNEQAPGATNPPPALKPVLSLIAGEIGGPGDLDGTGMDARFRSPGRIATDMAGNLYVADVCTVRKIAPGGVVTTLAGNPNSCETRDGQGSGAGFQSITALDVAPEGTVYVGDNSIPTGRSTIRRISANGTVTTLAGGDSTFGADASQRDGVGSAAVFGWIYGMTLDGTGNVYVTDILNGQSTIRKITSSGVVTTTANLPLNGYYDLTMDMSENFIVWCDGSPDVIKIGRDGTQTTIPLPVNTAQGERVVRFAVDRQNNMYAALVDASFTSRIVKVDTATGSVKTIVQTDGSNTSPLNSFAGDVEIDSNGNIFVSYPSRYIVQKIAPDGAITTYAGAEASTGRKDGIGSDAAFGIPYAYFLAGIASDAAGTLYVTDPGTVRRIDSSGQVITIAGGSERVVVNGKADKARFTNPAGITVDMTGNVFVTDLTYITSPPRYSIPNASIRKISPTGEVSTLAGSGEAGYADANGEAARFAEPQGIVADHAGNLYIADRANCVIRKITADGVATTVAGIRCLNGSPASQDGTGAEARFASPVGITIDPSGNLYVTDFGTDALSIRKVNPSGVVTTVVRGTYGNALGTGAPIQFGHYELGSGGIAADAAGNVYLADLTNHSIRRITQDGVVTTIVGGAAGIHLGASPSLYRPYALAVMAPNVLAIRSWASLLKLTIQ